MIDKEMVKQIQRVSAAERTQLIEQILQSLKEDLPASPAGDKPKGKSFKVRQFNLDREVQVERNGLCIH